MKAQKANKIITIPADQKDQYLQQGYTILDDEYKIIEKPVGDSASLKAQIQALTAQLAEKDKEIAGLKDQVVALSTKLSENEAATVAEPEKAEAKKK